MDFVEKHRQPEGIGWFVGIIGIIAVAQLIWNLFVLFMFVLATLAGIPSEVDALGFCASVLGVGGGVLLLIGLVLVARRIIATQPWIAMGTVVLIAKNAIEIVQSLLSFLASGDKSQEGLVTAALSIGSDSAQLIFWCFVLWLSKTWLQRLLKAPKSPAAKPPKLMGAQ